MHANLLGVGKFKMAAGLVVFTDIEDKIWYGGRLSMSAGFRTRAWHSACPSLQQAVDYHVWFFLPAAGYRNDTDLNDAGTNGNYWSSSLNENNPNNGQNLNFNNNGNVNVNNNNRYYGQSVRAVAEHLPASRKQTICLLVSASFFL